MKHDNKKTFSVSIGGIQRQLPLVEIAPGVKIALFNILGDTEIVEVSAQELSKKIPRETQILVTPEVKSIPLAYELSRLMRIPYIVARKILKPYMVDPLGEEVISITTGKSQMIWLDRKDLHILKNKKVALVDDVASTGSTLAGLSKLINKAKGQIVARAVVFTEGDKKKWISIISLGHLPVFINN